MKPLHEVRKALRAIGYKVSVRTLSWGPHASFFDTEGNEMPTIFYGDGTMSRERWLLLIDYLHDLNTDVCTSDGTRIYGFGRKN